jgi:hypothetical protein
VEADPLNVPYGYVCIGCERGLAIAGEGSLIRLGRILDRGKSRNSETLGDVIRAGEVAAVRRLIVVGAEIGRRWMI